MEDIFHKVGECQSYLNGNYSICLCNDGNLCNKASMLEKTSNNGNYYIVNPSILVLLIISFIFCIMI